MALSPKAKKWLIIFSIPIGLIVACVVTLKVLFTGDRLKSFIIPRIEGATHRAVSLNSIDLSIFPTLAIEVDGLTVSNRIGQGFSKDPMLQLDKLLLDVRLIELLKGNLEISTVTLEHPRLLVEVNKEGESNYSFPTENDDQRSQIREGSGIGKRVRIPGTEDPGDGLLL